MSEGLTLPVAALDFMNEEEPSAGSLSSLQGLSPAGFQALVTALEHRELIDHLEMLAEFGAVGREAKKAAAAAAYRLRSRGIKPRVKPTTARVEPKAEAVDLGFVALASPPGLVGRFWMLLGSLPGVEAIEVKGDADGGVEGVEVLRPVSGSKLEKLAREFERKDVRGLPIRASADLAVQLIRLWGGAMEANRTPPMWRQVEAWAQAAVGLGADPSRASARKNLGAHEAPMSFRDLYALKAGGIHLPTPAVIQRMLSGVRDMLDQPAISHERVVQRAGELSREAMSTWLSVPQVRSRLARWLEATADVMYHLKHLSAAVAFIALADALGPEADGQALIAHPFFRQLELELLGTEIPDLRR